jgi:uncharacterized protein
MGLPLSKLTYLDRLVPMPTARLLRCFRCGNVWRPRKQVVRICPLCKSRLWNTPFVNPIPQFDPSNPSWTAIVAPNREAILDTARRHRAFNPRVFGSVRRGSARRSSDLDLLVTFEPSASLFDQIELKHELEERLNRKVDVVSDRSIYWFVRAQVLAEAEPV